MPSFLKTSSTATFPITKLIKTFTFYPKRFVLILALSAHYQAYILAFPAAHACYEEHYEENYEENCEEHLDSLQLLQIPIPEKTLSQNTLNDLLSQFKLLSEPFSWIEAVSQGDWQLRFDGSLKQTATKWVLNDSQNQLWLLKQIPWYAANLSTVRNITETMQALADHSTLPIPKLVPTRDNQKYYKLSSKEYFILQKWMPGHYPSFESAIQLQQVGATLAEFHQVGKTLNPTQSLPKKNALITLMHFLTIFELEIELKNPGLNFQQINDIQDFVYSIAKLTETMTLPAELDTTLLHGDINPSNLLIHDHNLISGILDYDNLHQGDPLEDLIRALLNFGYFEYALPSTRFKKIPAQFKLEIMAPILNGYLQVSNLLTRPHFEERLKVLATSITLELLVIGFLNQSFNIDQLSEVTRSLELRIQTLNEVMLQLTRQFKF